MHYGELEKRIQEISGVYTSPFLDTGELKTAFRGFREMGPRTFGTRDQ